jgi:hypothetical protein
MPDDLIPPWIEERTSADLKRVAHLAQSIEQATHATGDVPLNLVLMALAQVLGRLTAENEWAASDAEEWVEAMVAYFIAMARRHQPKMTRV